MIPSLTVAFQAFNHGMNLETLLELSGLTVLNWDHWGSLPCGLSNCLLLPSTKRQLFWDYLGCWGSQPQLMGFWNIRCDLALATILKLISYLPPPFPSTSTHSWFCSSGKSLLKEDDSKSEHITSGDWGKTPFPFFPLDWVAGHSPHGSSHTRSTFFSL